MVQYPANVEAGNRNTAGNQLKWHLQEHQDVIKRRLEGCWNYMERGWVHFIFNSLGNICNSCLSFLLNCVFLAACWYAHLHFKYSKVVLEKIKSTLGCLGWLKEEADTDPKGWVTTENDVRSGKSRGSIFDKMVMFGDLHIFLWLLLIPSKNTLKIHFTPYCKLHYFVLFFKNDLFIF